LSESSRPDSKLVNKVVASPNHEARRGAGAPDMIVLHYTGMERADDALARLCDPNGSNRVSAHYFVADDGAITQLVPEARRAWHAGESFWAGESDINSRSIGIEIVNPGHDFGYPDFPARQIDALIALLRDIVVRNAIRADRVLAHSDVAPARKQDPGEKFPWEKLYRAGIGHWIEPVAIAAGPLLQSGARGDSVKALQELLAGYGYGVPATGAYDEATVFAVAAFQRHFRSARVDGIVDTSTLTTLRRLLDSRPIVAA
jgi:N-acetylmuramoyl-L-alanine amidase